MTFSILRAVNVAIFIACLFVLPAQAAPHWSEQILYACNNMPATDCFQSFNGLLAGPDGNLYGVGDGGTNGDGCVFELSHSNQGWRLDLLYNFSGTDGKYPRAGLVFDNSGNLYGTTVQGGDYGGGAAFELSPTSNGQWTETVLHSFGNGSDGSGPASNLIFDNSGNLYGTTLFSGGTRRGGTVYKLSPGQDGWTETILYAFPARIEGPNGDFPQGGVVMDSSENLYGNTQEGGEYGNGAVFELKLRPDGTYKERIIYSFNLYDGYQPSSGIVMDANESIYGTTQAGGDATICLYVGCGLIYKLTRGKDDQWSEQILYALTGREGDSPVGPVSFDPEGKLYWAASFGGPYHEGGIFMLTPRKTGPWKNTLLHRFHYNYPNGHDGEDPYAGVIYVKGKVFGTTAGGGGPTDSGVVFELRREECPAQITDSAKFSDSCKP
jgi:uncharacterized repeat protein (TIGR03803 family)